jgi:DNA-binding NtrC family response regulator
MPESVIAVLPRSADSEVICDSLGREGIAVRVASSPEEALSLLTSADASVVLYDADTGQPWPDALRRFQNIRPALRMVLLAASADHHAWMELFDNGAFDLLLRPLQPADLRSVVRCALDPPRFFHAAAA